MLKNIRNPPVSTFSYDARIHEINVFVGLSFYYCESEGVFELDQNPLGERDLVAVENLKFLDDCSGLSFHSKYRNSETDFHISSNSARCKAVIAGMSAILKNKYEFPAGDVRQQVSILLKKDSSTIKAIKSSSGSDADVLWMTSDGGVFCLIIPKPWEKLALAEVAMNDSGLSMRWEEGAKNYEFALDPVAMKIVRSILEVEFECARQ